MPLTSADCDEDGIVNVDLQAFIPVNEDSGVAVTANEITATRFALPAAAADGRVIMLTNDSTTTINFRFGDSTIVATLDNGIPVLAGTQVVRGCAEGHGFTHVSVISRTPAGTGHVAFGTAGI